MKATRQRCDRWCARIQIACVVGGLVVVPALAAQTLANAADSASRARQLSREAAAALRAGDTATAHARLVTATTVWPTQPAYLWTRAQMAAAARDTNDVVLALTQFAALGMTRLLEHDRFLAALASAPRLATVAAALMANATPVVNSTVRRTLADSTIWPEGVAHDARSDRFFVGSVRNRNVYMSDARGSSQLWRVTPPNVGAVLGVAVDPDREHLWLTTAGIPQMSGYTPADSTIAALLKVRLGDGTIVARWDLPRSAAGHTLGDVTVSATGDLFMSDSREPVLYRLAKAKTFSKRFGIRSFDRCRASHRRRTGGMSTSPTIRTGCCASIWRRARCYGWPTRRHRRRSVSMGWSCSRDR